MEKNKLIRTIVMPVSVAALVVLLFLIRDQTAFIFVLPAVPIIYGCITKEKIGAILIGVLPFAGLSIIAFYTAYFGFSSSIYYKRWLVDAIPFWLSLTIILGLEGYFASRREILSVSIAICLYILWFRIFLLGVN